MVLECLNGLFGHVAAVVVRGDKFECHVSVVNFSFVCRRRLVVKNLMSWCNAASGHLGECPLAGEDELTLAVVLEGFTPC